MRLPLSLFITILFFPGTLLAETMILPAVERPDHVVLVIEENKSLNDIIGNKDASYFNQLAQEGALMTESYAVMHPSLPNYIALFSGSTNGVKDDGCQYVLSGDNLAESLNAAGLTFKTYAESMPDAGYADCKFDLYRKKHNPAAYFSALPRENNKPFSDFPQDFSKLPTVSFVIPNMNDDMHDGTIAQANAWLQKNLDAYVHWAMMHNSLLIVTWDEDDDSNNNHIPTIVVGAYVKQGSFNEHINHYNVLKTLASFYGVKAPNKAKDAKPITTIWMIS